MPVRDTILEMMENIAQQQKKTLLPLHDDQKLFGSGLDSLCIAILVAELDDEYGVDPLSSADDSNLPTTVGEFIRLYENAIQ